MKSIVCWESVGFFYLILVMVFFLFVFVLLMVIIYFIVILFVEVVKEFVIYGSVIKL